MSSSINLLADELPVCQTIPDDLKLLIRTIMRTFYGFELYLTMEMLMMYPCIKEDDLAELLRLDLKVMQQNLKNLKKEKFINEKALMETSQDGNKQSKQNYFYINYKMMVNVIKYKLDKIRQQIEIDDKQFTTRAQFKCTQCHKTYNDLDTKDIFITMRCVYCGGDIDEDASSMPSRINRNLIHTFNTQMRTIFELLSRVENVRLADHLLRPDVVDMTYILDRIRNSSGGGGYSSSSSNGAANGLNKHDLKSASTPNLPNNNNGMGGGGRAHMIKYEKWSGDRTRNMDLLSQTKVSINIDSSSDGSNTNAQRKPKELPSILLLNRTTDEDSSSSNNRDSILLESVRQAADETIQNQNLNSPQNVKQQLNTLSDSTNLAASGAANNSQKILNTGLINNNSNIDENSIMQLLLKFEKKSLYEQPQSQQQQPSSNIPQQNININNSNMNTSIIKKRPHPQNDVELNSSDYSNKLIGNAQDSVDSSLIKKRRLNNGGLCFFQKKFP
jgi:transcription initiation factor IIE alpha subunit